MSILNHSNGKRVARSLQLDGPEGPLHCGKATLHHIGFVVRSITSVAEGFGDAMSATWDGKITHDPTQQVRVTFLYPADPRNPVFELVEPASETSPVSHFLRKQGGLHHLCYEVDELEATLEEARAVGIAMVAPPTPAVAFEGRRIAWVCSRNRLLMEFLERQSK